MDGASILVVEDDPAIADGLLHELSANGYCLTLARTGRSHRRRSLGPAGRRLARSRVPDLDGVYVCRTLRRLLPSVPIVILTARDTDIDIVVGLDAGASDYVTKPFSTHVLLARLRAHLRTATTDAASGLVYGTLRIDTAGLRVYVDGTEVLLRPKEVALLIRLASSPGRVLSRDQLLDDVWDMTWRRGRRPSKSTSTRRTKARSPSRRVGMDLHGPFVRLPLRTVRARIARTIVGVTALIIVVLGVPLAVVTQRFYESRATVELQRSAAEAIAELAVPPTQPRSPTPPGTGRATRLLRLRPVRAKLFGLDRNARRGGRGVARGHLTDHGSHDRRRGRRGAREPGPVRDRR
ncbi:MAG: response regulator transcription factor [Ilumatobacteraceae bacterium]